MPNMAISRPAMMATLLTTAAILTACASGPVRRVSDPAASLQQIQVQPDGSWNTDLRIQNYSSIPMRFDQVNLKMMIDGQEAATIAQTIGMTVGPESPDVHRISVRPTLAGKALIAESLSRKSTLNYRLTGTMTATPEKGRAQTFKFNGASSVTPAPGLPGVLR